MSHHKNVIVDDEVIGYVRITNDGKILSFWHHDRLTLFLPEDSDGFDGDEEE
jgi:hypothetical protein